MIKRFIEDDEDWIAYLYHQIDKELNKGPKEQDWDRIEEYLHELDEACKGKYDPDPARKEEKLKELRELYRQAGKKRTHPIKRPRWLSGAIAACLLLVILGIPVASAAINHISPVDVIRQWGSQLLNIPFDVPVEKDGIIFIKNRNSMKYDDLDVLIETEDVHILFPAWLPEGVYIDSIYWIDKSNGAEIVLSFSDTDLSFVVMYIGKEAPQLNESETKSFCINGTQIEVLFLNTTDGFEAMFDYQGARYDIHYCNDVQLMDILNGLRWR